MDHQMIAKLKEAFPGNAVGKLPKVTCKACADPKQKCGEHVRRFCKTCKGVVSTAHMHVDFVGHAFVTERLWEVDPDWSWEPLAYTPGGLPAFDEYGGLWVQLTIGGQTRLGYGDADGRKGVTATKIAIGDAIRNAAMRFQVALDMWKKDKASDQNTPVSQEEPVQLTREELIRQIKVVGRTKGKGLPQLAGEFSQWCKDEHDFAQTQDTQVLTEFRDFLQGPAS